MTISLWLIFFIIVQVIHFLGTWKLYKKAGRQAWEALVPVYNAFVLMKIINRPWWWVILLFVPIVNLIMFPVIWVETIRSFGRHSTADTWLAFLSLGFYIFYVNYALEVNYIEDRSLKPRTAAGEWVNAILFAIVAATIVHTYFIQPFTIPTSSLEKTLLVGDFLFVSKINYGPRVPMTTIAAPMVHDTIPVLGIRSYLKWPKLPYFRLPGFEKIERNDIVVFNWPTDTVPHFHYHGTKYIVKPIDKKSNYVKRCVAVAGDTLSIRNGKVYIDGQPNQLPGRAKIARSYKVTTKSRGFNRRYLYEKYNYTEPLYRTGPHQYVFVSLTKKNAEELSYNPNVASIEKITYPKGVKRGDVFPQIDSLTWNIDNYGPIYIPKEGATVKLTPANLPFYQRIIEVYEGKEMGRTQQVSVQNNQVYMNGSPIDHYTFHQNYFWMMGDNRHNSEDSRYWGFVPETHIVGKPIFIWMSIDHHAQGLLNKIRWDRLFTTVRGQGEPISFFPYFVGAVVIVIGVFYFRKKRKKKD